MKDRIINDIVRFIMLKRVLRYYVRKFGKLFYIFASVVLFLVLAFNFDIASSVSHKVSDFFSKKIDSFENFIFDNKIENMSFSFSGLENVRKEEVSEIISGLRIDRINKQAMRQIVEELEKHDLIKTVYIKKQMRSDKVDIFIKEKEIVALINYYDNSCASIYDEGCKKTLIKGLVCEDDTIVKYRDIKSENDLIVIKGMENGVSTNKFIKQLIDSGLYNYIVVAEPFACGRWNIQFANGLLIKLPRKNADAALRYILELDEKYKILSNDINIKYLDLRLEKKIYVGE